MSDVAAAAGVSRKTLTVLLADYAQDPHRQVTTTVAYKVLAVRSLLCGDKALVDALATRRRVEALMAIGWAAPTLAVRLDLAANSLAPGRLTGKVRASTDRAVRDLYERLRWVPGPSMRTRQRARRDGFAPPTAWNRNIDDPRAMPEVGDLTPAGWREAVRRRHHFPKVA